MASFKVTGGRRLKGEITPQGAKNEALQILCAVLLTPEEVIIENNQAEIDRLTDEKVFKGPIYDILKKDLGMFGIDELFGLEIAGLYGTIGKTNFGDIDVNKPLVVDRLNDDGKHEGGMCHTFMDDIVGAIAAAASTRIAQVINEEEARKDPTVKEIKLDLDL